MVSASKDEAEKIFDLYVSSGGNFIDTANNYQDGDAETWLGEWITKKGIRDELVIATKYSLPFGFRTNGIAINHAGNHRKNMFLALENSLKRLNTSYVDILYLHYWDFTTPAEEIMRAFDDLVRSGKVHYIAISDTPAWEVSRMNMLAELRGWSQFIAYQGRYHLGDRTMERDIIPMCKKLDIGIVPWGVLGQGKFTGKYKRGETVEQTRASLKMSETDYAIADEVVKIAAEVGRTPTQVCVNWALQQGVTAPVLGTRSLSQLQDCLKSLEFSLTEEQMTRLNAVSKFDLGFPGDFIGTTPWNNPWLKRGGVLFQEPLHH